MIDRQETLHFLDYWRIICARKEIVISVALLVILTGVIVTISLPKVYMASCVIEVKEETPDVPVFSPEMIRYNPLFLRTQFEIIQSRPVIEEVVRKLNLTDKLASACGYAFLPPDAALDRTVRLISGNLKVQQYRDTNLIEVQIYMSEPADSVQQVVADIANAVVDVYCDQMSRRSKDAVTRALSAVEEELNTLKKKVHTAEDRVEEIRKTYKITLITSYGDSAAGSLDKVSLAALENLRITARVSLEDKKAKLGKIMSMSHDELSESGHYVVGDPSLNSLVGAKRESEVQLSALLRTLGPNHPDIERIQQGISELNVKIDEAIDGMKRGVRAEYEVEKAKLEILEDELEALKAEEIVSEGAGYREFNAAKEDLRHAKQIRDELAVRHWEEKIELRVPKTIVEIVEMALAPGIDDNVSPDIMLNIMLSIIVALGAGIGLAFFIEYLDTSVKTIEDVERYMNTSVLGVIPQRVKPFTGGGSDPSHAEAYRVLRANIQFSKELKGGKSLCVTSGSVGEGKSLTVLNYAFICAQLGDRSIIVDSDLHRPRQHKMLGYDNKVGLVNVLMGESTLEDSIIRTNIPNLDFLPSGKATSGTHGLLDTRRMKELLEVLKSNYDVVMCDAPPIIGVSDASLLAREADGVLLIIQHRKYPKVVSGRAKDVITNVGGNLIGVVLNNINISRDYSYYYQHYYYSQYSRSHGDEKKKGK